MYKGPSQWRIQGVVVGVITPPPPWTCPDTENLCKVHVRDRDRSPPPLGMWMTSHGQCPRGGGVTGTDHPPLGMWMTSHGQCPRGGGVLVNVQEWGVFYNFLEGGWRHADNVQGGCFTPPPGAYPGFSEGGGGRDPPKKLTSQTSARLS